MNTESGRPFPQIGPYIILEELGRGATAQVYLAKDQRDGRQAVLKVLTEVTSIQHQKRFAREVIALRGLVHPCIVRVLDAGSAGGRPWYAMERLERRPLDRVLRERFDASSSIVQLSEARQTLWDVASALAFAHERKVVHRDLKPSNILVDAEFHATLIDFGVARLMREDITKLTATGDFVGTPSYAAPEQLETGTADFRTDIYAFGLLGYELLAGKLPLADLPPIEMIRRRAHEPLPPASSINPTIPPGVDRLLLHCLEADPTRRYQGMGDLVADLDSAFAGGKPVIPASKARAPSEAHRPSAAPAPATAAGRWTGIAIGLALAVVAAGAAWSWRARLSPAPHALDGQPRSEDALAQGRLDRLFVSTTATAATIRLRTPEPAIARLIYKGPDGRELETEADGEPSPEHAVSVEGLQAGSEYRYKIVLETPAGKRWATSDQLFLTKPSR
ncbi:MAG: serine/threonine protein kinase [Candidatus Wallbacteria bacterium]|nr:serine/threonine protein kinase [Candidatus Wallbacteria bacterium]